MAVFTQNPGPTALICGGAGSDETRIPTDQSNNSVPDHNESDPSTCFLAPGSSSSLVDTMPPWSQSSTAPKSPVNEHGVIINPMLIGSKLMSPLYTALHLAPPGSSCGQSVESQPNMSSEKLILQPDRTLSPLTRAAAVAAAAAATIAAPIQHSLPPPSSHCGSFVDRASVRDSDTSLLKPTQWIKSHSSDSADRIPSVTDADVNEQATYKSRLTEHRETRKPYAYMIGLNELEPASRTLGEFVCGVSI
ncbi:unnamed protein product [Echinostoma caproni]|uniref:Uncharacterized protein n=1 Tax=Echinostoma caproni TaxID=27848 RepID=A0A183AIF3_9TREM|nr:unnamed protein product [Echinostoma caproni]